MEFSRAAPSGTYEAAHRSEIDVALVQRRADDAIFLLAPLACRNAEGAGDPGSAHDPNEVLVAAHTMAAAKMVVETVAEQDVDDTIITSGRVAFDDLRVAHVYSPVNGRVTKMFAQLGDHVRKGQPLCSIESPDIAQAVSDVHKATADFTAANNDYKRLRDLEKQHAAATRDVEAAEDRGRQAKAELERAEQKAAILRARDPSMRWLDLHGSRGH